MTGFTNMMDDITTANPLIVKVLGMFLTIRTKQPNHLMYYYSISPLNKTKQPVIADRLFCYLKLKLEN
jgi:hypothetical protein